MKPSSFPEAESARPRAKWRWVVPLAALCLLLAIGAGLGLAYQAQQAHRGEISSAVLQRWLEGGFGPLWQAGLLLALWMLWHLARNMALFLAFLGVEAGLSGRPGDPRAFRFALKVQFAVASLFALGATAWLVLRPVRANTTPVVNLGQAEVEAMLGPLAPVLLALVALLVYDFMTYWIHRAQHRFAILWRFHSVHHSVEGMDSLNSYQHPVDRLVLSAGMALVALSIGFAFETVLLFLAFQTIHDRLIHTRAPINFGILGGLLIDNRTHFLHHTRIEARSGKNFAATFTLFDRLFGTYERPGAGAGALPATGIEGQGPPASLWDFFLARLDRQPPAEPAGAAVSPATPAGARRSRPPA